MGRLPPWAIDRAARGPQNRRMAEKKSPPGRIARDLMRACDRATLATALAQDRWPYASLVMTASAPDASPLLLLSDLAEHSKNVVGDQRASLLFDGTMGLARPLTGPRVTVLGRLAACAEPGLRARYLARHPDAAAYFGFADFKLYRMTVERAHLVAGFGAIHWIAAGDLLLHIEPARALFDAEDEIVAHMNQDHAEAIQLYAANLLGREAAGWRMTGLDSEGCDLRREGAVARLGFSRTATNAEMARAELVRLVKQARQHGGAA